jgi:predicted dehydrogenase
MVHMRDSRREFLKKSIVLVAAGSAVPYVSWSQRASANVSANDRPKIGCIGMGGQGTCDAREHTGFADIVAVCDVDSRRSDAARNDPTIGRGKADACVDYRKVLERKDIDVVSISTTDHWHVKIAIEALQAGKHVFCQKPLTLTLEENQLVRKACKKYKDRVFIVGTQRRTQSDLFVRAVNMVQKGLLGNIRKITVGLNGCPTGGPFPKVAPPKELDWNMWLGQTPKIDYIEQRCHYNFRWWYEYSGGKFTDWGAHFIDTAMWAIQHDREGMGPIEIDGADAKHPVPFKDGYPTVSDCYNTSSDFAVKCRFANGIEMIATSRGDAGILFEGTKGRIFVDMGRITGKPIEQKWDEGNYGPDDLARLFKGKPFEAHKANFYRCIREGGLPVSDVFSHVQTLNTCHLCAIAARLGRTIKWDPMAEKIVGDGQAAAFFARAPRQGFEIPRVQ